MKTDRKEIFKSRFNEHYPRLCSIAYEYVSDADDSEDIVQELFINIWDKGKDALPDKEFAAYITTAVKNACISFLRKKMLLHGIYRRCPIGRSAPAGRGYS